MAQGIYSAADHARPRRGHAHHHERKLTLRPELRAELDGVTRRLARFQAETRALSESQFRFRPDEGSWSIAEVAQHLLQVEREITNAAVKTDVKRHGRTRSPKEWLGYLAFLAIFYLRWRIKVPGTVAGRVTPVAEPDMDQLWREWSEVRAKLAGHLETIRAEDLGQMAYRHPIMGPTSVRGILPFFRRHFDHHMRQIARIRRSPYFPRA